MSESVIPLNSAILVTDINVYLLISVHISLIHLRAHKSSIGVKRLSNLADDVIVVKNMTGFNLNGCLRETFLRNLTIGQILILSPLSISIKYKIADKRYRNAC